MDTSARAPESSRASGRAQQVQWMWDMVQNGLRRALRSDPELSALIAELEDAVGARTSDTECSGVQVLARFADRAGDALKRG